MISATALNASTVPLNKSPQMPLGLDNSRLRVDSQKFLVPSLPVSSRQINPRPDPHNHPHHHNPHSLHYHHQQHNVNGNSSVEGANKRRSIHPISPVESSRLVAGMPTVHNLNGLHRRSTSPLGSRGTSPNYGHNMQNSPRKDAHSPMYAGEVPGYSGSPGNTFSARSSVPIPCSSPSPGTSASPKSSVSHSLSPSNGNSGGGSPYAPHLPPGLSQAANGASELSQLAVAAAAAAAASGNRLYPPGFPPSSAAAAHHAAFYAAAAAAAAGHSLPYPSLFGSSLPYPSHQHPAANSYLDFHSKLLRNSAAASECRSSSESPPSRSYQPSASPHQPQSHNILQPLGSPQSTSVTSLHTKLIESVSAAGDRYHPHHLASHNHIHSGAGNQQPAHTGRFSTSPVSGLSKGGPLGISGGIMGLSISPNSNSPHKGHSGPTATSATPDMSSKSVKPYMEHPGLPNSGSIQERKMMAEMELTNGNKATKEALMLAKQTMMSRSPEDFSTGRHRPQHQEQQPTQKIAKSISFASDVHSGGIHRPPAHPSYINGHASHQYPQQHHNIHSQHSQGHHQHHQQHPSSSSGATNLSSDCKKASHAGIQNSNNPVHPINSPFHHQQQHHLFLPPSPKKRSAHWNFAVPQSPLNSGSSSCSNSNGGKSGDLLPPPPPPSSSDTYSDVSSTPQNPQLSPSSKYLSPNQHNQKPSNGGPAAMAGVNAGGAGGPATAAGSHYQSTNAQQLVVPNSPLSSSSSSHGGSGPSTPKSPSVHFRFFGGANNKENSVHGVQTSANSRNGKILNARNDSSSSSSSVELGVINGNGRGRQNNGHSGPWPVEQMPVISAFRKGSMIKLASGDLKAVEELNEKDFEKAVLMTDSVRIVYCHVVAIQPIPDSSMCKVTLAMGAAQNQQVVVESSPEQPFFIRGRGWSSSAPKLTEKLLQLPCTMLAVGDICITLTRQNGRNQMTSISSGGPGTHQGPGRGSKTKSGVTRPYGTYSKSRNSSTSSILKSSQQSQQRANNSGGRANSRKLAGRPAAATATTTTAAVTGKTNFDANDSNNCTGNFAMNNNSTSNPITRHSDKISPTAVSPLDKEVEHRVKSAPEGKEADLSLLTTNSSTASSVADLSTASSSSPLKPPSNISNSQSDSSEPSSSIPGASTSTAPATTTNHKRKSISPSPLGTERNKDDAADQEDALRPTSPKKRRWSAPEQMEVDSQQINASNDKLATTNTSKSTNPGTNVNENRTDSQPETCERENQAINDNRIKGSDNAEDILIKSEQNSPDIPPEKA